jgi:hypothetical protein
MEMLTVAKPGLYANIHAKRLRIAKQGSGEKMRKPGALLVLLLLLNLRKSAKTAKKK